MRHRLFQRKTLHDPSFLHEEEGQGLKRHLGWFQLIVIGIGAIIGAGIFVITGTAAADYAGPAILLSFIVAALICVVTGLCYAELATMIPVAGGAYAYAYVALGEFVAWTMGWLITGQYLFSLSTVAVGWSGYFRSFLRDWNIQIPTSCCMTPFHYDVAAGWSWSGSYVDLPAVLLVLFIGLMVSIGIRAAARMNSIMVAIKLAVIVVFILVGIPHIDASNWTPFIPENTGVFGEYGLSGVLRAAGLVFFAYLGFDTVATLAQDAKNPQKDLPRGILGSLGISAIAYIIIAGVLTGVVSYTQLGVADPMAVALNAMGPSFFWIAVGVKIAILAGLASVVLVQLLGQTRIFLAVSKDGLLPMGLAKIHPATQTPLVGTLITTAIIAAMAALFPVEILGQLVSILTLFIFGFVCLAVLILRKSHPKASRSFKVPFVPILPFIGVLICLGQMLALPLVTWIQMFIWLGLGALIYFAYGMRHSKLRKT